VPLSSVTRGYGIAQISRGCGRVSAGSGRREHPGSSSAVSLN
jgi:hypothetical protein